jgi:hypothetical protein
MSTKQVHLADHPPSRLLAVVDWSVDPRRVAELLRAENQRAPTIFALLVPSRLRPVEWIGDPYATRPCAERQLDELSRLSKLSGLAVEAADVGDPERVAAIRAFLEGWPAERVVLFDRARALPPHPLSIARRIERRSGIVTESVVVPQAQPTERWLGRGTPHCLTGSAQTA